MRDFVGTVCRSTTWPSRGVVSSRVVFPEFRVLSCLQSGTEKGWGGLAADSKVAASPSLLLSIHPTLSPTPANRPRLRRGRGEGEHQTLKEGATGPRRGTHIHAPGKHKHHACRVDSRRSFASLHRPAIGVIGKCRGSVLGSD